MPPRVARLTKIEIAPRTVIFVGGLIAGAWLLRELWTIAVIVLVALMLVGTLSPLVGALQRRGLGRTAALVVLFFGLLGALSLVLLLTLPPLIDQVMTLAGNAPARRDELVVWLESHRMLAPLAGPVRDAGLDRLSAEAGSRMLDYSSRFVTIVGYSITAVFLAFYLLADGERAKGALFAVVPRNYHVRLARILIHLETIVGGYVRGQLITSAALFGVMFVLLTALGVPNALSLSAFGALVDVIPFVGGLLATAPAVAMASSRGSGTAITVLVVLAIYQEVESRIIVPRVYGRVLRLSPAAVLLALLIGGSLLGVIGALLALPVAAGLRMVAQELRVELPGDDSSDPASRARDAAAERRYHVESAGAPPVEAAAVASAVALDVDLATVHAGGETSAAAEEVVEQVERGDRPDLRPAATAVDDAPTAALDPATVPGLAAVALPAPRPGRRGGGVAGRRADRADPGPRRHAHRPGSLARPIARRR